MVPAWIGQGEEFVVNKGERIAQLLFSVPLVEFREKTYDELLQPSVVVVVLVHLDGFNIVYIRTKTNILLI